MKKKIAIAVDHSTRDLPSCALLASELSKSFRVFLVPVSQAGFELFRLGPDFVLLNCLRETNKDLVKKLLKAGIRFAVLDTEGGIYMDVPNSNENTYTMTILRNPELRKQAVRVYLWGKDLFEIALKREFYSLEQLRCFGSPRMDFYHSSFSEFFEKNQTEDKKQILINTSFAGNNPRFSSREKEMLMLINRFGYQKEFIEDLFQKFDRTQEEYIRLTILLAKSFPETHFLIRPHPFENSTIYRKQTESIHNISVGEEGSIFDVIHSSLAVIHFECSTAVEAAFLRKPVFSSLKFKDFRPVPIIQAVTDYIGADDDWIKTIQKVLKTSYVMPEQKSKNLELVEASNFFKVDGKSFLRISKDLEEALHDVKSISDWKFFFWRVTFFILMSLKSAFKLFYRGHVLPKGKKIEIDDLLSLSHRLTRVTGTKVAIKQPRCSNSFEISFQPGTN
jgi:surface carbohydrate biosynthesis protein